MLYAIDAEKSVLGSLMLSPYAISALDTLTEDDFHIDAHKTIFSAMRKLKDDRRPIDLMTMEQETNGMMTALLVEISRFVPSAAMIGEYVSMVKDASSKRKLVYISESVIQQTQDGSVSASEIVEYARGKLRDIASSRVPSISIEEAMGISYAEADKATSGDRRAIKSGITTIDRMTGGFHAGELTVLAARTAIGKSAMAMRMAINAARAGKRVYFASLEMSVPQLCFRMCGGEGFDSQKIRNNTMQLEDWNDLADAMARHAGLPLQLDCKSRYVEDVCAEVYRLLDSGQCDIAFVDYSQKLKTREKYAADHLRVGGIVWKLKELTLDLNIPVMALAQVKRNGNENGFSKMPTLEDLKDSGALEMDADNVILLHMPNDPNDPCIKDSISQIQEWAKLGAKYLAVDIAKQRQGPTGKFNMLFVPARMEYREILRG